MKRKLMLLLTCLFVGIGLVTAQTHESNRYCYFGRGRITRSWRLYFSKRYHCRYSY